MFVIDRDSYGTLVVVFIVAAIIIFASLKWLPLWLGVPISIFMALICIWQLYFFRVPDRDPVGTDKLVTSAADGKVVIIDEAVETEYLHRTCKRVCVYMDFFDVHVNFWPVTGKITYYKYHPGKHLLAFKPKASEENEHASACIKTPSGDEIVFKQHAGTFARRIVNYSTVGDEVAAGEQCGIIKFGSRMDIYMPLTADIKVSLREQVVAAETVIASL